MVRPERSNAMRDGETLTHFGDRDVPLADKQALVDDVFHRVARRYDLMNDLMSAGLHRAWKDVLLTEVNPPKSRLGSAADPGQAPLRFDLLDIAGGTGGVALLVLAAGGPRT